MAIQRLDGYVYSCAGCGTVYPVRRRRGGALQDEVDHHRVTDKEACTCPVIADHRHHLTGCVASLPRPVVAANGTDSPGATS